MRTQVLTAVHTQSNVGRGGVTRIADFSGCRSCRIGNWLPDSVDSSSPLDSLQYRVAQKVSHHQIMKKFLYLIVLKPANEIRFFGQTKVFKYQSSALILFIGIK